jgi:predicted RNA-binding Zn-ribbon protein involved in translation (DUF1610 family)
MTRIRATCPVCGEVELTSEDVQVRVLASDDGDVLEGSIYRFRCPTCETMVTKSADDRIVGLLESGGVAITRTQMDVVAGDELIGAQLPEHPEQPVRGATFTLNDVIDFHELLEREDWFAELSSLVS